MRRVKINTPQGNYVSVPLISCPFCGEDKALNLLRHHQEYNKKYPVVYYVECSKCGARSGKELTEKEAVLKWSVRAVVADE